MFNVDDRVRLQDQTRFRGKWQGELTVVRVWPNAVSCQASDGRVGLFLRSDNLELVPAPRLYRKGDKVTITYEVVEDQAKRFNNVRVTVPGRPAEYGPLDRHPAVLDLGTLDPAPEPPYVPQVGDKVFLRPLHRSFPYLVLFIDETGALLERGDHRAWHPRQEDWQLRKAEG